MKILNTVMFALIIFIAMYVFVVDDFFLLRPIRMNSVVRQPVYRHWEINSIDIVNANDLFQNELIDYYYMGFSGAVSKTFEKKLPGAEINSIGIGEYSDFVCIFIRFSIKESDYGQEALWVVSRNVFDDTIKKIKEAQVK